MEIPNGRVLTEKTVNHLYGASTAFDETTEDGGSGPWDVIKALCMSHESLRSRAISAESAVSELRVKLERKPTGDKCPKCGLDILHSDATAQDRDGRQRHYTCVLVARAEAAESAAAKDRASLVALNNKYVERGERLEAAESRVKVMLERLREIEDYCYASRSNACENTAPEDLRDEEYEIYEAMTTIASRVRAAIEAAEPRKEGE